MSRSFQIRNFKNPIPNLDILNLKLNSLVNLDLKILSSDSEYQSSMSMDRCTKNFYIENFKIYIYYKDGFFNVINKALCGIDRVVYIGVVVSLADILKGEISSCDGAWHNCDIYTSKVIWNEFLTIYNGSKSTMDRFYNLDINSKLFGSLTLYQLMDLTFNICNLIKVQYFKDVFNQYLNDTYNSKFLKDVSNIFKFAKSKFESNSDFLAVFGYLLTNKEYSFIEYDQFGEYIEDLSEKYLRKSIELKNQLGIAIYNKMWYNYKANENQLQYLDNFPSSISKIELKEYLT